MKLKVGDRVAAYEHGKRFTGTVRQLEMKQVALRFDEKFRGYDDSTSFHEKQCRKLVKSKRREWFLRVFENGRADVHSDASTWPGGSRPSHGTYHGDKWVAVRVREVRAKR